MKKILLGTTAIAMATATSGAMAADPISLGLGGGWTAYYVSVSQDNKMGNTKSAGLSQSSEFSVSGETTLDNGLKVGVSMAIDGDDGSAGDSYAYFGGDFGTLKLGNMGVGSKNHDVNAPSVAISGGVDGPDSALFMGAAPSTSDGGGSGSSGVDFTSGSFGGFSFSLGYVPDNSVGKAGGLGVKKDGSAGAVTSVGATFSTSAGGADVTIGAGYDMISYDNDPAATTMTMDKVKTTHFGASLSVSNLTFGAGYSSVSTDYAKNAATSMNHENITDATDWNVGVKYAMDALSFSLAHGSMDHEAGKIAAGVGNSNTSTLTEVAVAYDLGAGVSVSAAVASFDWENKINVANGTAVPAALKNSATTTNIATTISF